MQLEYQKCAVFLLRNKDYKRGRDHTWFFYSSGKRYKGRVNETFCMFLRLKYKDLKSELHSITIVS